MEREANEVIRQAISCDICGTEKKQTNHWFVAYDHGGELRVGGWKSRNRMRPGAKHLCGQTCLHKLVDEFMARDLAERVQPGVVEESEVEVQVVATDASLTSNAAYVATESSARLVTQPIPVGSQRMPLRSGLGVGCGGGVVGRCCAAGTAEPETQHLVAGPLPPSPSLKGLRESHICGTIFLMLINALCVPPAPYVSRCRWVDLCCRQAGAGRGAREPANLLK